MASDQVKLFIAIPAYNGILSQTTGTLVSLTNYLQSKYISSSLVFKPKCANIDYVRAELLSQFYHSDFTHCLFVDADMSFDPSIIYRMLGTEEDLITCVYKSRHYPYEPLVYMDLPQSSFQGKNGEQLIKINYTGLGCTLISRKAVEAAYNYFPELHYTSPLTNKNSCSLFISKIKELDGKVRHLIDDYAFFDRMKEAGFQASCLPDAIIKHEDIEFSLMDILT